MKKHSCGAILYTIYNNKIYIIDNDHSGNEAVWRERSQGAVGMDIIDYHRLQ